MGAIIHHTENTAARYAAFMSYAHADEARAALLHSLLERYRPPAELASQRHNLRPVFRDKNELTASHSLTDEIREAVKASRKLIVLCSPAAKSSRWVNEEIRLFRKFGGEDAILCALVEGTPETSFPPALTEGGREPLAADLTGSIGFGRREGFRYGMMQLAASMLDVGLDALVRREQKRRQRRGAATVFGALAFAGVMGLSAQTAIQARKAAEASRNDAEGLVEYMITDLKTKLETVGRLDILNGVGSKAMEYYGAQLPADMTDERLARQARAQHLLGQAALDAGRYEEAKMQIDGAYALTREVLARSPEDSRAIFAHAQSAFWVGNVFDKMNRRSAVRPYWEEYHALSFRLYERGADNFDWVMEAAWAENNLGIAAKYDKDYPAAAAHYQAAITLFDSARRLRPDSELARAEAIKAIIGAEQTALAQGDYAGALTFKRRELALARGYALENASDITARANTHITLSNFLWEYNLFLSAAERNEYKDAPRQKLAELNRHDPDNLVWARQYYWHLIVSFQLTENSQEKAALYRQLKQAAQTAKTGAITEATQFYIDGAAAQMAIINNDNARAQSLCADLEARLQDGEQAQAYPEIILAQLYIALGETELAQSYAKRYLARGQASRHPDLILKRAQAHVLLGQCGAAKTAVAPLRPFADPAHPHLVPIFTCGS